MQINERDVKTQLETLVTRRNQIGHEADLNIQDGSKNNISDIDVKDSVNFIEKLGNAIFDCVK
jgi:hypothetical protein